MYVYSFYATKLYSAGFTNFLMCLESGTCNGNGCLQTQFKHTNTMQHTYSQLHTKQTNACLLLFFLAHINLYAIQIYTTAFFVLFYLLFKRPVKNKRILEIFLCVCCI